MRKKRRNLMLVMLNKSSLECKRCKKIGGFPAMIRWHYKRNCKLSRGSRMALRRAHTP